MIIAILLLMIGLFILVGFIKIFFCVAGFAIRLFLGGLAVLMIPLLILAFAGLLL